MDDAENQEKGLPQSLDKEKTEAIHPYYWMGKRLNRALEECPAGGLSEIRTAIARASETQAGTLHPLVDPYRLALIARQKPHLHDWPDDLNELLRATLEATKREIEELETSFDMPPRILLLIDSLARTVDQFFTLSEWQNKRRDDAQRE